MIHPRALRPGDRLAVVAPASNCPREELDRGVAELARLGYQPVFSDALFERGTFSAGSPESRAADFMRWWTDPEVAGLIALRGGYGSVHLLPLLDAEAIRRTPKLFVGYSDTTTLLSWLTIQCGVAALHGPMLEGRLANGPDFYDRTSFEALLTGGRGSVLSPDGVSVIRAGDAAGRLYGGTLTQLVASLGTPYSWMPPEGSVLFVEDVNERPYRLDRMLTQLALAGVLDRARALIFGEMRGCDEPGGQITARAAIEHATRDFAGPIIFGFPSGHTTGRCWTLPLGVAVRVTTGPEPRVIIEEAAVA
jgi:muramoyltetrapeptide carboxypeptidase